MADGAKDIYVPLDLHDNEISGVSGINGGTSEDIVMGDGSLRGYPDVPTSLADLTDDPNHRLVTDVEKAAWNSKYSIPGNGIPKADLSNQVRASLNRADTAVQPAQIANFVTASTTDLVNYYLKSETYTKDEVQDLIAAIQGFSYDAVSVLPTASADTMGKIYLVPSADPQAQNVKDEYITIDNGVGSSQRYTWEQIGSTAIDLSDYVTVDDLNDALDELPVVRYVAQQLTEVQKAQARTNIGATSQEVFLATYGTTTYEQLSDAEAANKLIVCKGNYAKYLILSVLNNKAVFIGSYVDGKDKNFEVVTCTTGNVWSRSSALLNDFYTANGSNFDDIFNQFVVNGRPAYFQGGDHLYILSNVDSGSELKLHFTCIDGTTLRILTLNPLNVWTSETIQLYSIPQGGIPESDLSQSVKDKLNRDIPEVLSGTTEYWNSRVGYIPPEGTIIIYTDKDVVDGENVPGIKIGSGNGYVQDLAFVGDETADALLEHISNNDIHITAAERISWSHKIDIDETGGEIRNETIKFIR